MNNRKGFTLVELLVVIVILGIITGISIPLIRNIQARNEMRKYTTYMDSMKISAKLYVDSYSEDLFGHSDNGCAIIKYSQMEEKGLLKDIQIDKVSCASDQSFVKVVKVNNKIGYSPTIACGERKSDGTIDIDTQLPENGITGINSCGTNADTIIEFYSEPANSNAINFKKRNITVYMLSNTGIHEDINISYSFIEDNGELSVNSITPESLIGGWKKLEVNYIGGKEQKKSIEEGNPVVLSSNKIQTPDNRTGDYALLLRIDNLKDLAGENWSKDSTLSNYLTLGPYKIDNQKPVFGAGSTVVSSNSNYNHIKPKLKINVTDTYSTTGSNQELRMCISYDTDTCSKKITDIKRKNGYVNYEPNKVLDKIQNNYDGSEHTIYVTVGDAAGNYQTKEFDYKVATGNTLTYDSNGGNACDPNKKSVFYNTTAPKWGTLCTPTRKNYTFTGWNTKQDGSGTEVTSNTTVNGNIKVYAQWRKNKVIFQFKLLSDETITPSTTDSDGTYSWGTNENGLIIKDDKLYTKKINFDAETLNLADYNNPAFMEIKKKGNHGVNGEQWICDSGCNTANTTFSQKSHSVTPSDICNYENGDCTVTIRVNWEPNVCKVTFDPNGGKFTANETETVHNCKYKETGNCINDMWNANGGHYAAELEGYIPKSTAEWILADGTKTYNQANGYRAIDFCSNLENDNQDVTINVNWEPKTYTLTFDSNGGSACNPETISKKYNTAWGTLCTPTLDKFNFKGWNTKKDGSGTSVESTTKATSNITVYAQWENAQHTLTYDSNGGSACSPASITKDHGKAWGTLCSPTRPAHTFDGWNTKKNGSGTTITNTSKATDDITVYAQWSTSFKASFHYTGKFTTSLNGTVYEDDDFETTNTNYTLFLLTSGKLTVNIDCNLDIFAAGGGGGGSGTEDYSETWFGGGGGAGGYTASKKNVSVKAGTTEYDVTIGSGGAGGDFGSNGSNGTASTITIGGETVTANGGHGGKVDRTDQTNGTGKGGGLATNGGDGICPFSDCDYVNYKYGGGGGGGRQINCASFYNGWCGVTKERGTGGADGGADALNGNPGPSADVNTAGGGAAACAGEAADDHDRKRKGGAGGSGIVIIRNKR